MLASACINSGTENITCIQNAPVELALNHRSGMLGGVAGICQRHRYAKEVREAFELWSQHIEARNKTAAAAYRTANLEISRYSSVSPRLAGNNDAQCNLLSAHDSQERKHRQDRVAAVGPS